MSIGIFIFTGVVRSMHCNPDFPADIVPVDVCMNAIITAAWERGLAHGSKDVEFRNIVSFFFVVVQCPCDHAIAISNLMLWIDQFFFSVVADIGAR